jgi:hypothetical protein
VRRIGWPEKIAIGGLAFAVVASLVLMIWLPLGIWSLLIGPLWLPIGAAGAAGLIVAGTAIERVRGRPLAIAHGSLPRTLALAVAAGYAAMWLLMIAFGVATASFRFAVMTAVVVGWAAIAWRAPLATTRARVLLLAATFLIVELPRELGVINAAAHRSWTDIKRDTDAHTDCREIDWHGDASVATATRAWRIDPHLTGNVGHLLDGDDRPAADGELVVRFEGHVDAGWIRCLLPFYKSVSVHSVIGYDYDVHTQAGGGDLTCHGTGTLTLDMRHEDLGSSSCLGVRQDLSEAVQKLLADIARGLADGK